MTHYLWHSVVAKDTFEDSNGASYNDVIADVLHDGGRLPSHQGEQYRCLVKIPEEEQLPSTGSRAAYMAKQVCVGVPKHTVKTKHHLETCKKWLRFYMQKCFKWNLGWKIYPLRLLRNFHVSLQEFSNPVFALPPIGSPFYKILVNWHEFW